jgi:ABC-type nitrate/sulfonate/bicarbonate transport system substrate-binding protein
MFVFCSVFWGFLVGCGDNTVSTPASVPQAEAKAPEKSPIASVGELRTVRVATPSEPATVEIYLVGDELGIFQKHGIKLDFVGAIPTTQHVAAVVSGQIDADPGRHVNRVIAGIAAGAKVKVVVGKTETTEKSPHMVGIVPKNSSIKGARDLIGKKIGIPTIGGCNEYTPYAWLEKNGIKDPKTKVEFIVLPERNLEQALRQGELDLAMVHNAPDIIAERGEFDIVFSDFEVFGVDGGATPIYFRNEFIKDNPETVRAFVAAVAESLNWSNDNPYESRLITARRCGVSVDRVAKLYFAKDGIIKPETVNIWIDLLTSFGEIKPGLTADQVYTNEFNPYY